ncbi:hypothetical protein BV898_11399 [Hypsibius exemplaris]|uniref:C2H2-type domain-containing protein n=1 Tax=Hypsibius exemplaris TaxID=2072580 RepID=A0A1W0WGW3_HYPEX|nr:hypothetical protein BV898_11399 [Hypsibius exemplaris]
MSQGLPSQAVKATTSRVAGSANGASGPGSRLLQNYPQEPIGTRPSYVGELMAILRDGTPELRGLLEAECDLRFNCKVCGSILPSTRSFVIHKRQFCTTKYIEHQRRNVTIMERISNVVSYDSKCLQTGDDMLDPDNPVNACLLIPLPPPLSVLHNGDAHSSDEMETGSGQGRSHHHQKLELIPAGVEVIQPSRPPADGVYRFGMGGESLLASKKKKTRVHASGTVKKKRKQAHVIQDVFSTASSSSSSPKKFVPTKRSISGSGASNDSHHHTTPVVRSFKDGPIMTVTKPPPPKTPIVPAVVSPPPPPPPAPAPAVVAAVKETAKAVSDESGPISPAVHSPLPTKRADGFKRSRRLGPPINGFDMDPRATAAAKPVPATEAALTNGQPKTPDVAVVEEARDVKDPVFIRQLLDQMCEVADYHGKKCRECNRTVVSIYNLDRHVATQHLGLKESEYSLISKELRRLRSEVFGPGNNEPPQGNGERSLSRSQAEESSIINGDAASNNVSNAEPTDIASQNERDAEQSRGSSGEQEEDANEDDEPMENDEDVPAEEDDDQEEEDDQGGDDDTEEADDSRVSAESNDLAKEVDFPVADLPVPTTSKPAAPIAPKIPSVTSDSEKITKRLTAMIQNPDTLKDILTTKDKPEPPIDYELDQLVDIQRQIFDAADPSLQVCRICNKQFFDVYVLNRHVMTVHLRLPERSCGTINKMIKDSMKKHPHAFGAMIPLADGLAD